MTFWFGTYTVLSFVQTGVFAWETPFSSKAKARGEREGVCRLPGHVCTLPCL